MMKITRTGISVGGRFWNMHQQKRVIKEELDLCILALALYKSIVYSGVCNLWPAGHVRLRMAMDAA